MKVRNRISVLSVPVDVITQEETVNRVQSLMQEPGLHIVVTANAEMIMHAQKENVKVSTSQNDAQELM